MSEREKVDPDDFIDIGLARKLNAALDEIDALEAERDRLREIGTRLVDAIDGFTDELDGSVLLMVTEEMRAALEGGDDETT